MTDWLRIAPAPGVTREQARITSTYTTGIGNGLFWLDGVSIELNQTTFIGGLRFLTSSAVSELLLTDVSVYDADNPGDGVIADISHHPEWRHRASVRHRRHGHQRAQRIQRPTLVRDIHYERLGEDIGTHSLCLLNITFNEVTRDDGSWHPDFYQMRDNLENVFVFGVSSKNADAQMIFQGVGYSPCVKDAAFINIALYNPNGASTYSSQLLSGADHLLIWHCHLDQTLRFETVGVTLSEISVRNSYVGSLQVASGGDMATLLAAGQFDAISQGDDGGLGTNPIAGSTVVHEDIANGDFCLLSTDPGYEACTPIAELDYLDGSRGARNATTPDAGPFLDAADPTVGFSDSPSAPSYAWPAKPKVPLLKLNTLDSRSVGLLGAWSFSEGSGDKVRDASGRGFDLTLDASHSWVTDAYHGGAVTGSTPAYSDSAAGVFPESESCSVSILFSSSDPATSDYFVDLAHSTGAESGFLLYHHTADPAGQARILWRDTSGVFGIVALENVLDGRAHRVVLSFDGSAGRVKVSVDGIEVADVSSSEGPFGSAGGVARLRTYNGSDSRVYDAKLWNRTLTPQEIAAEYTDPWTPYKNTWLKPSSFVLNTGDSRATGLVCNVPVLESSGSTSPDMSGNGHDLTSVGARAAMDHVGQAIDDESYLPAAVSAGCAATSVSMLFFIDWDELVSRVGTGVVFLLTKYGGPTDSWLRFYIHPSNSEKLYIYSTVNGAWGILGLLPSDKTSWIQDRLVRLVFTHDPSGTQKTFVNGTQVYSFAATGDLEPALTRTPVLRPDITFGVTPAPVLIGDIKIWDRALTEAEIEAEYVDPWGLGMGPAAPELTLDDSLAGRTLTITVDSLTGSPPPTAELTTLTLDGCDVRDQATGSGPWVFEIPASTDTHTVVWGVTASNSEGTAIASGSEVVDGGSSTAPSFTVESSASLEGRQITITPGVATGSPSPTLSIAATLDSVPVTMTGSGPWTYDVPSSSAAQLLEWVVSATNSAGSDTSVGIVTIDEDLFAPAIAGLPWVVGAAVSGQTLVATAAPATGTPPPTRSWQWYRAPSTAIAGATSSSYTLQVADEGLQVFVRQTEMNSEGVDSADSPASAAVVAAGSASGGFTGWNGWW
jgi:hypothetical protein